MPFSDSRVEAVQEPVPEWGFDIFAIITDLGDPLFFILLVSLIFWLTDHETALWVIVAMLLVFGLTTGLKELIAIERPPAELQHISDEGFGIPSGHTSGSVAIYGTIAALYQVGHRWVRYGAAALVAGLIALSRIVLGVHYLADIIAGAVLGLVVIAVVLRYRDRSPVPFFAVAAIGALVGAGLSGFEYSSAVLLFGGALAALVMWFVISPLPNPSRRVMAGCSVIALPLVVGTAFVGIALVDHPVALIGSTAGAMAIVLALPVVGNELGTRFELD